MHSNYLEDLVEIRSLYPKELINVPKEWTKVSRFLACGLMGIEVREIMKINEIKKDFLEARKAKDELKKNLLSTFIGEYENQAKGTDAGDDLVHAIAKKMIKSAEQVGTEEAKKEIDILNGYLPAMASKEEVAQFLKDKDLGLGGRLIGLAKSHFSGNVDPKLVQEVIKELS